MKSSKTKRPAAVPARARQVALAAQQELWENLLGLARASTGPMLESALRQTLEIAARLTGATSGSLFLLDEAGQVTHSLLVREEPRLPARQALIRTVLRDGLAGWVLRHRRVGLIQDTATDERWVTLPDQTYQVRSALALPILREDTLLGLLTLLHGEPGRFTEAHVRLLEVTASQLALVLENARLVEGLQQDLAERREAETVLRRMRDELELRVQERTAALTAANDALGFEIDARQRLLEEVRAGRQRLQALSQQLLAAQEAERRHIARELHDEIGQALTAIKIHLQTTQRLPEGRPLAGRLDESIDIVDQVLQQVRSLSLDLRPSMLDDLGLVATLRWYVARLAQRADLEADLEMEPDLGRLPAEVETICFRVAQEALTNVMRHAQAQHVQVQVRRADGDLFLSVQDDGQGFDVAARRQHALSGGSAGLLGMQERVILAGGRFEIVSAAGRGTRVDAWLPIQKPRVVERRSTRRQELA